MLHQVPTDKTRDLIPLAAGLADQGMAQALLEGTRPGIAMVDSVESPSSLFLLAPEGAFAWSYLAGDPSNASFHEAVNEWLFESYGPEHGIAFTFLVCDKTEWETALAKILEPRTVIPDRRLHYACAVPPVSDWRKQVPGGYEIRALDRELLHSDVVLHEKVTAWLKSNFGSEAKFLERAFGAVAVHQGEVAAWCLPDSVGNQRTDIGVETTSEHQQRGLATFCTCLVLEQAFDRGIETVGWHCHQINLPSNKTAQKTGFKLQYEYPAYAIQFDPEQHQKLADVIGVEFIEQAEAALAREDYVEAHMLFSRLLGFHQPVAATTFLNAARSAAMAKCSEDAFRWLTSGPALEEGFSSQLLDAKEFRSLHSDPRWQAITDQHSS